MPVPPALPQQTHRIAHEVWVRGNRMLALALQSRMSECFNVDIHPGARLGAGMLLDHGTGVVIGETAVVGAGVSVLHGVTLGGECERLLGPEQAVVPDSSPRERGREYAAGWPRQPLPPPSALGLPQAQARKRATATPRSATTCS